jgi:hypothetical protein
MPLTTRLWFSIAVLVIAALMPVNPLTVLLIFALAMDALVGMLLARDLSEGRRSVMAVDADAIGRHSAPRNFPRNKDRPIQLDL